MGKRKTTITENSEKGNEEYSLKLNKKIKRNKKKLNTLNETISEDTKQEKVKFDTNSKDSKQKKKKNMPSTVSKEGNIVASKPKKYIFIDDEPQEVSSHFNTEHKKVKRKNKHLNDDEAEVKDEDIDKFCDELDDNDNSQYEEWVKLIEAKLHPNKR